MTEHPNYKYRPRRRKQNKARPNQPPTPVSAPPTASAALGSPYATNTSSPDRFAHNPGAGFSPYRTSPLASDYQSSQFNGHVQTPESSPARSPEPQSRRSTPADAPLPTPDASPVENEKENFYEERRRAINASSMSDSYSQYKYRTPGSYSPAPIAAMPMPNGMYVMCTQRNVTDPPPLVTGTFFPPVATSQDQQTLGTSTPRVTSALSGSVPSEYNIQYHPYEQYEQMYKTEDSYVSHYPEQPKTEYDTGGSYFSEEPPNQAQESEQGFMNQRPEIRTGSPESDLDAREFDKYLDYAQEGAMEQHQQQQQQYRYEQQQGYRPPYCGEQPPGPEYCSDRMYPSPYASVIAGTPPAVYAPATPGTDARPDDEFSVILAGVRQTCYSN